MRLTKIYTKFGDKGKTALASGLTVDKTHPRICAYGDVDELNAQLGLLVSQTLELTSLQQTSSLPIDSLQRIQQELFDIGGELSFPEQDPISNYSPCFVKKNAIDQLEAEIDRMNASLKPLKNFVLPGGNPLNAQAHVCRTVCRRAERSMIALAQKETVREELFSYINRLSDWLFVLSRQFCLFFETEEILWDQTRYPSP